MVLATDKFADLARHSAVEAGLPNARIVILDHPIGGVASEELGRRAEQAVDEIMSRWLGMSDGCLMGAD